MRVKTLLAILFISVIPVYINAQSAADLENLLNAQEVTCAQAAWFVSTGSGSNQSAMGQAFDSAVSNGWLKNVESDTPITLGKLSFLIMQAFEMKGGLMYMLIPGPRYAYRSLVSRSVIQGSNNDPDLKVSGDKFLTILGKVMDAQGENK
jgi:hypothetical protein